MIPLHMLIKRAMRKYNEARMLILADWAEEVQLKKAANEFRKGCTANSLEQLRHVYFTVFGKRVSVHWVNWALPHAVKEMQQKKVRKMKRTMKRKLREVKVGMEVFE